MPLTQVNTSGGQVSGVDDLSSAASSVVNWEVDDAGINRPRPGLASYTATGLGASKVIGLFHWAAYVLIVTEDRYIWAINDSVPEYVQPLSTAAAATHLEGSQRPTFVGGDDYVYIAGGGRIMRWNTSLPSAELISGSPACTHIATLGNYLVANDLSAPSVFRWSDIGEGAWTSWPAANASSVDARPDPIVAIYENTNEVLVFGSETTQVYAIGSDATLPFDRISAVSTGLGAPYACALIGEEFAVLDSARQLCMTDGRSFTPFGDAVKNDIDSLSTRSDCWAYYEARGQQVYVIFRFPTARRTFVYDLRAQKTLERAYYLAPFQTDWPVGAYLYWPRYNYHLFGSTLAAGGLMRFDPTSRQDLGGPLVCERTEGWHDFGTQARKASSRVRAIMRRGTAAEGATPGALEVRVQNDDSAWSAWKQLSIGAPGDYGQKADTFATNGIFRRRRYATRFSTTEDFSLVSLHDDIRELAS